MTIVAFRPADAPRRPRPAQSLPTVATVDYSLVDPDDLLAVGAAIGRAYVASFADQMLFAGRHEDAADADEAAHDELSLLADNLSRRLGTANAGTLVVNDVRRRMLAALLAQAAVDAAMA